MVQNGLRMLMYCNAYSAEIVSRRGREGGRERGKERGERERKRESEGEGEGEGERGRMRKGYR